MARRFSRTAGTAVAAAGVLALTAVPTSAAPSPAAGAPAAAPAAVKTWRPVDLPAFDKACSGTLNHPKSTRVFFQTCIVHGNDNWIQPVLIVSNLSDNWINIGGDIHSHWVIVAGAHDTCAESALAPGAQTSCWGTTTAGRLGLNTADSQFYLNGMDKYGTSLAAKYVLLQDA
ncbi:hypothetical protein [Kitasatospora sp. NPDC057500]|uniref:hypothetical protein n=1 Tax=Kitasatospora sp. NPDC057500 TaxID=3346151 RepID=UPI0036A904C3